MFEGSGWRLLPNLHFLVSDMSLLLLGCRGDRSLCSESSQGECSLQQATAELMHMSFAPLFHRPVIDRLGH